VTTIYVFAASGIILAGLSWWAENAERFLASDIARSTAGLCFGIVLGPVFASLLSDVSVADAAWSLRGALLVAGVGGPVMGVFSWWRSTEDDSEEAEAA
jgi:MFS family permease